MNLAKGIVLVIRDVIFIPMWLVRNVPVKPIIVALLAIAAPLAGSLLWGWHNGGFWVLMGEAVLGSLGLLAVLRYGRFERIDGSYGEYFVGWKFDNKGRN